MNDGDAAARTQELYESLRDIAFAAKPEVAGFPKDGARDDFVYGAIMEFRQGDFFWTVFCVLEEAGRHVHLGLYSSSGFMVVGERFPDNAFLAARWFIQLAGDFLHEMSPAMDHRRPPDGSVRLYALAVGGLATVETSMEALTQPMDFSPLIQAGVSVIDEMMSVVPPPAN
jgi:hypothetical protein